MYFTSIRCISLEVHSQFQPSSQDYDMVGFLDTPDGFVVIANAVTLEGAGANPSTLGQMNDEVQAIAADEFSSRYPEQI